jgi:hypothetical protein
MRADVCIVIPDTGPSAMRSRAVEQVARQDHAALTCLVVGSDGPAPREGDARFSRLVGDSTRPVRALREVCGSRPERHVLWLDPRDELAPGAVGALLAAAGNSPDGAAVGGYVFWSGMGVLPGDPTAGLPGRVGLDDWLRACVAPAHAVLVPRTAMAAALDGVTDSPAWDWRLWLRMATAGTVWSVSRAKNAAFSLRPGVPAGDVQRDLAARAALVAAVARSAGVEPAVRESLLSPWVEASAALRVSEAYVASRGAEALHGETRFPEMFARWWQRLGYLGPAPRHVLEAHGGLAHCFARWPEAVAAAMVDRVGAAGRAVVVGLGRNGRCVAGELHRRGHAVIGFDDGPPGPPSWEAEDGVQVRRLGGLADLKPGDCCLVTPWHDNALVARLPAGVRIIRWSFMPREMAQAAVAEGVRHAEARATPMEVAA